MRLNLLPREEVVEPIAKGAGARKHGAMATSLYQYATLEEWIERETISFSPDSPQNLNSAVDAMIAALGESVELLGFGEPLHGAEEFLVLRNRLFQRLAEKHGFTAIAIESSFPRGRIVNEYAAGGGTASYDNIKDRGFSHGFGESAANRELVEWIRQYNADPSNAMKLRFYGFDSPTEMMYSDSPRALLEFALNFLETVGGKVDSDRRTHINELLGEDAAWQTQDAAFDPSKSIGLSPAAASLRIEVEELVAELEVRRPELVAASSRSDYSEAMRNAEHARQMLTYHAAIATDSPDRLSRCLGLRDVMMADNLAYIVERERGRGKIFAFAHNSHLKLGAMEWQLGPNSLRWWPAGAQISTILGDRYAVIGTGIAASDDHGIRSAEGGSLEAHIGASPGPARLIPTCRGRGLPAEAINALATRSSSTSNSTYFPLTGQSIREFDWLMILG